MESKYISFSDAKGFLSEKFGKTPTDADFWMWGFFGKENGGIDTYLGNKNRDGEVVYGKIYIGGSHQFDSISRCINDSKLFRSFYTLADLEQFQPIWYITADELLKRWTERLDNEKDAKSYVEQFAVEWADYDDVVPRLRNHFVGANPGVKSKFEPFAGVYLFEDVLNLERFSFKSTDKKAVAEIKASRTSGDISVDVLLKQSIEELLSQKNLDEFNRYFELYVWKKQLERDINWRNALKVTEYGEQVKRDEKIAEIRQKIKDIEWHLDDCPVEQQAEAVGDAKPRKKLKPKQRDRTEGLLLIYEIVEKYNVQYLDKLLGLEAWAKIVSKEFTSELIKSVSDTKQSIMLASGKKLNRSDFLDNYRRRFE